MSRPEMSHFSMHAKSIITLEYPKIIERLLAHCAFSASRALAQELQPSDDASIVRHRLALTTEARRLLDVRPDVGVRAARDVRPQTLMAQRDAMLLPEQLIDIQMTLRSSAYLNRLLGRLDETYPLLRRLGADLPNRPALDAHIEAAITDDGAVRDTASPQLHSVRGHIRTAQQRLQDRLNNLVNEFRTALQDNVITMREGRYVLPVRSEARGQVRGIIHDQSSSGATVFIEPLVIVEMNNKLRELELEERREVERILTELSAEVAADAPYILLAVELLAEIDLQFAKARYSQALKANPPTISNSGIVRLVDARHPLLTGKVVPLNFRLGEDFQMVVITGPNTGGKTVALKTVGLLALMAQAGLHIPADDRSVLPIYRDVLADIGDEQSIEQSLSTFSSHMTRIIEILHLAGPQTLVLLDELGAGTDPSEGSALARAILLTLLERGVACVATTHYSELKAFAHEQAGVTNASVEFDVETLSPTYRLSIGIPGRSNALAIASRLGLDASIIERARGMADVASATMEQLLAEIQHERKVAADERYEASMAHAAAEDERRALQDRVAELESQRTEIERERIQILNAAREDARKQIQQVRSDLGRVRVQAQRGEISEDALTQLRAQLRKAEERTEPLAEPPRVPLPRRRARATTTVASDDEPQVIAGEPQVGDPVRIISLGQIGELRTLPDGRGDAEVQVGALKLRVAVDNLERLSRRKAREERSFVTLPSLAAREIPAEQLDLRGQRAEEVFDHVDRYLNDAYMGGLQRVRIVHGKGTGALRQVVRTQLSHHPLVKSFTTPPEKEGGDGVTEVVLAH
jgi:DNA mismatch repair protein MutS2